VMRIIAPNLRSFSFHSLRPHTQSIDYRLFVRTQTAEINKG
jgi:hypothetical protein